MHEFSCIQPTAADTPMKATIIFLPPFLHSCQNVPPAINSTNTGANTTDGGQHRQRYCADDDSSSSSSLSSGGCGGGSCCQWAHNKNSHEKHATQRRAGGDGAAASSNNSHKQTPNGRSARNGRDRRKSHLLHLSATNAPRVVYCGGITAQPYANIGAAYATTTTARATTATTITAPIATTTVGTTKLSLESEYREVTATPAAAAAVLERIEAHASVRATLKTHSCLADSLRLRNRRQLVMPIVENSLVNATATPYNSQLLRAQTLVQAVNASAPVQRGPATATGIGTELTPKALRAPTTTLIAVEPAALADIADSNNQHKHISQTTITTLDCRCFKDNGDICMAADELNALHDANANAAQAKTREHLSSRQSEASGATAAALLATLSSRTLQRLCGLRASQQVLCKRMQMGDNCAVWWSKLLLLALLMLMLTSSANCWTGRQDVSSNCTFPARWEGSWFLSGYQQSIHIKGSQFSYRGKCAASDGNKYLIVDEKGCHRCLVIYEKHKNVLQYKESECEGDSMYMHQTNPSAMAMRSVLKQNDHRGGAHPNLNNNNGHSRLSSSDQYIMRSNDDMNDYFCKGRETLQNLCDQIPGDALLYSLFRESAEPVKCPLKGPFIFTYNRGHGECKSPVSNIESCTEDSRLLLSFQACPDVQGTESTVEELTCLATWKDGNSRYLVGLVSHHHAISNEERYRCFVYEKISSLMGGPSIISSKDAEYKLAQSGDATCNGLDSAEVGSRIMSLRKPPLAERCDFPVWFKGPRHWHALMGNAVYNYHSNDGSVHIIKPNGFMETRALCEQINKQTPTEMMAVVHYTTGCQSGFMCMMFYRRDTHVIEIQTGKQASRLEDACAPDHFDINRMPFITLLASNPDPQICPMEGLYNLRGAIGPPYLTTRHKRNHNNKLHTGHGHHHGQVEAGIGGGGGIGGYGHKRHATLSFRNSDRIEKGSWHANTRGLPVRSRRAAITSSSKAMQQLNVLNMQQKQLPRASEADNVIAATSELTKTTNKTAILAATKGLTSVGFIVNAEAVDRNGEQKQRNRRDSPGCVTNYKAQRRLWVGCTEPDVIDVRPKCSDDDDEEYFCHGSWSENGTVYIIARHKGTKHGVCISYRPTEGTAAKLVIGDACYRGTLKPPEHHLVANLSIFGKCGDTGSATSSLQTTNWLVTLAVALLTTLLGEQLGAWQQGHRISSIDAISARTLNRR